MSTAPPLFPAPAEVPVGRYMVARRLGSSPRAPWAILNARARDQLGRVEWYPEWSQYVLVAESRTVVWSSGCLRDVARFMDGLTKEAKS